MDKPSKVDHFINSHPKLPWQLLFLLICLFWQSILVALALPLYFIAVKKLGMRWWFIMLVGVGAVSSYVYVYPLDSLSAFISTKFYFNKKMWHEILSGSFQSTLNLFTNESVEFSLNFSLALVGILAFLDLIPEHFHAAALRSVMRGALPESRDLNKDKIDTIINNLPNQHREGTLLGVSKYTANPVIIADSDVNQVVLILGTTGAGKTITLRRFYQHAIETGLPLIIIDGKPENANTLWLEEQAKKFNKEFIGFNCMNYRPYNCLAKGGYTELKDKIICLKDEWSSDYYRSIAEDYLQTTLEVLLKSGQAFDLNRVTECLEYSELVIIARSIGDKELMKRVGKLSSYEMKDITGLQAHLNLLINSELGHLLRYSETAFNLKDAINNNALVYFALPALQFPSFASVLGKLIINDLKAVINDNDNKKVFTIFDEFSVFASDQVLNLVNMGRGKGVHAIFGTQGIGDLMRVGPTFSDQILNCVNTLICHRVNDKTSAQTIADWVATKDTFKVTGQLDVKQSSSGVGTVRSTKEYIIHPDNLKQELGVGEVFYITKVGGFKTDKVKVIYT